ncbi:FAD-containing oxidoreductase [Devosia nitrariae]|uniref:Mercuric reductase n=1 Tax=Devosia nitrariae TaxID=2071872 RepID=A0ABQ5VZR6_9HYPH|nr:FAD-containing oxidoreductase [Devosia nitrariae]GLQ53217.1 mercuric reductase [Devosia nitrariae]
MPQSFDAIVIGAGQSGPFLAARLAGAGWKTALIERTHLGGTCVNDGCTPTKALVASARAAHMARRAADFGVVLDGGVSVDMEAVKARKDAVVGASVKSLNDWLRNMENLIVFDGEGSFVSASEVAVDGEVLAAPRIFLNTGARPQVPEWPGIDTVPYLTNTTMMDVDFPPEHLVIAGASYVGLEFAQMYRRFGSKVTVIDRRKLPAPREDAEISEAIRDILTAEGVEFLFEIKDVSVENTGRGVRLSLTAGGENRAIEGSHLLLALGRTPNTDALNLPAAGLSANARGFIEVDEHLRTAVPGIWAMGDVNGRGAFTHTSYNEFEIVADNVIDGGERSLAGRIPAYALYTDPPLGRAGMNERQVRETGRPALVATLPMQKVARAREKSETQGMMKIIVDAESKRILGAAILGIEGDEVIHTILAYMAADKPYTLLQETMHIHPTVSELVPTLLGGLKPLE